MNKIEIFDGLTYQQNKLWELLFPHDEQRIDFELSYQFAYKKFNNFFTDVIENLGIEPYIKETEIDPCPDTPIDNIVRKYENHPSILKIKEHVTISNKFSFAKPSQEVFQKEISKINPKKAHKYLIKQ